MSFDTFGPMIPLFQAAFCADPLSSARRSPDLPECRRSG